MKYYYGLIMLAVVVRAALLGAMEHENENDNSEDLSPWKDQCQFMQDLENDVGAGVNLTCKTLGISKEVWNKIEPFLHTEWVDARDKQGAFEKYCSKLKCAVTQDPIFFVGLVRMYEFNPVITLVVEDRYRHDRVRAYAAEQRKNGAWLPVRWFRHAVGVLHKEKSIEQQWPWQTQDLYWHSVRRTKKWYQ